MNTLHNPKLIAPITVIAIFLMVIVSGFSIVQSGEVGVQIKLGKVSEKALSPGLRWVIPFITQIEPWNVKTREITESAKVPSSEGLISTLDVSVLYHVEPKSAPRIRMEIGPHYLNVVVAPNVREAIRGVASGYKVSALYSDSGRAEISQAMLQQLQEKLGPRGIIIEDVLLRSIELPRTFLQSIEAKLRAEQESLQKEFELQKAVKDAEIEVAQARGVADANQIIAESITEEYIQYLWVQGLNDGNSEVIYVPTEANLPILEASRITQP